LYDAETRVGEKIREKVLAEKETVQAHNVEPVFQQDLG
jgi:hypothetical protein